MQNTAINTALNSKILAKMRRDNLEYQKIDIALKRSQALEDLRKKEFYKSWLDISKDNASLREEGKK